MQYNGLGTLGVVLPELNHAADWLEHAEVRLSSGCTYSVKGEALN